MSGSEDNETSIEQILEQLDAAIARDTKFPDWISTLLRSTIMVLRPHLVDRDYDFIYDLSKPKQLLYGQIFPLATGTIVATTTMYMFYATWLVPFYLTSRGFNLRRFCQYLPPVLFAFIFVNLLTQAISVWRRLYEVIRLYERVKTINPEDREDVANAWKQYSEIKMEPPELVCWM